MTVDALRYLATRVIRYGLSTEAGYEQTAGFAFWCDVLGVQPALVRARVQ